MSVPQELAGGDIQCPECKCLASVPGVGDLEGLDADGVIKVRLPTPEEQAKAHELAQRAYFPQGAVDEEGRIDLRPTLEEVAEAGGMEIPLELKDEVLPGAPKYDPVTGELIEPLAVKPSQGPVEHGIPEVPTLNYQKKEAHKDATAQQAWGAMFRAGSLVVLGMVLLLHGLAAGMLIPVGMYMAIPFIFMLFLFMTLMAHYATVVEEVGVFDLDELPTPLRGASMWEDLLKPFGRFALAVAMCYGPGLIVFGKQAYLAGGALGLLGTFLFPAVFLTTCTSGSIWNLRLDRVFGVIGQCGVGYVASALVWTLLAGLYPLAVMGTSGFAFAVGQGLVNPSGRFSIALSSAIYSPLISWPLMAGAVCLMHLFCWHLGLLYRKHHEMFPWVLQRHISTKKPELPPRRKRSYVAKAAAPQARPVQALPVEPLPVEAVPVETLEPIPLEGEEPSRSSSEPA